MKKEKKEKKEKKKQQKLDVYPYKIDFFLYNNIIIGFQGHSPIIHNWMKKSPRFSGTFSLHPRWMKKSPGGGGVVFFIIIFFFTKIHGKKNNNLDINNM